MRIAIRIRTMNAWILVLLTQVACAGPPDTGNCDFSSFEPVRISEFIPRGVVNKVLPEYPERAFERGLEGQVTVRILVSLDGTVKDACATVGGPLSAAAEEASRQWIFKRNFGFDRPRYGEYAEGRIVFLFEIQNGRGKVGVL